jgi:hypothetical protein
MVPALVIPFVLYVVARGYRMIRASGYAHYLWLDGILLVPVLLLLLVPLEAGSREAQMRFILLVLGWVALRATRIRQDRRAEQADPERWKRWERALLLTPMLDRLLLRFPVQLYQVEK